MHAEQARAQASGGHGILEDATLDLIADNALTDPVADRVDAGIRPGGLARDVVALPLGGPLRAVLVAAPAYFARHDFLRERLQPSA